MLVDILMLWLFYHFLSGPVLIMVLEKVNAVSDWRSLIGPTDASKAKVTHPNRSVMFCFVLLCFDLTDIMSSDLSFPIILSKKGKCSYVYICLSNWLIASDLNRLSFQSVVICLLFSQHQSNVWVELAKKLRSWLRFT